MNSFCKTVLKLICTVLSFSFVSTSTYSGEFVEYDGPKSEIPPYEAMERYAYAAAKKHDIILHNITPSVVFRMKHLYGLWFISYREYTLEEGRALAGDIIGSFYTMLSTDPAMIENFAYYRSLPGRESDELVDMIGLRIAYWDENVDRPKQPALAEIRFFDKRMHYYVADPKTQALQLVYEESYEDAVAFAKKSEWKIQK